MSRLVLLLVLLAPLPLGDGRLAAQQPQAVDACEAVVRRDNPEIQQARARKKQAMRENGVPERYLHLVDKEECLLCINTAPDTVFLTIVWKEEFAPRLMDGRIDEITEERWYPQTERQLRDDLVAGRIESFHVWLSNYRCRCCPEEEGQTPQDDPGWDDDLNLDTNQADTFDDPSDLPPLPDDLKNAPAGWVPPPPLEKFEKPRRRYMHVVCDACQPLADQWNSLAGRLDFLWDRKVSLLRQINITMHAIGDRRNEINNLEYQQRFDETRTAARAQEIERLEQVNRDQQDGIDREERQLEEVESNIASTEKEMSDVMQKVLECEKACRKTTTTTNTTANTTPPSAPAVAPAPLMSDTAAPPVRAPSGDPLTPGAECPECNEAAAALNAARTRQADLTKQIADLATARRASSQQMRAHDQAFQDASRRGDQAAAERLRGDLQADVQRNLELDRSRGTLESQLAQVEDALPGLRFALDECNLACVKPGGPPIGDPACTDCAKLEEELKSLEDRFGDHKNSMAGALTEARRYRQLEGNGYSGAGPRPVSEGLEEHYNTLLDEARGMAERMNELRALIERCRKSCATPTTTSSCTGDACGSEWRSCTETGSCKPIDEDCGVIGTPGCPFSTPPGVQPINLTDPQMWGSVMNIRLSGVLDQLKFTDPLPANRTGGGVAMVFPALDPEPVRSWFNPLGLLARSIRAQVDRWRGSIGPRPFITTRDLALMDSISGTQAAGVPQGVHLLLTDRGGSTGKTLGLQLLNLSGRPVQLSSVPFAIEPLDRKASQAAQQAFAKLAKVAPQQFDLSAYCLEFLKAPPSPNTIYRLAPKAVQDKFAPISKVLRSAYRIERAGMLNPDSNPAAYTDAIKQWAVWTVEQRFNERSFTDAFLGHTKKNVEAAGQKWANDMEGVIRKASPNRWQDILKMVRGAGLPLPQ